MKFTILKYLQRWGRTAVLFPNLSVMETTPVPVSCPCKPLPQPLEPGGPLSVSVRWPVAELLGAHAGGPPTKKEDTPCPKPRPGENRSPKRHIGVLPPGPRERDNIWKEGGCRWNKI